jgi:hypothetical protein
LDSDGGEDRCPSPSSPLDPFQGEVSMSSGVYECRISHSSAQG